MFFQVGSVFFVPALELYPVLEEHFETEFQRTSETLCLMRFFFDNLWASWDEFSDADEDWVEEHLDARIEVGF